MKPDREIFKVFERTTGFAGSGIVFFDDIEENVLAARDAGWRAEHTDNTGDTAAQLREHLGWHGVWR